MKKLIKIRVQNGLTLEEFKKDVFDVNGISSFFDFIESDDPDYVIFGPYGQDIPPPGSYIRIGYYCENIKPNLSNCEWAFGIPREDEINNPKYSRIQWHGIDPASLIKKEVDIDDILKRKTKFCNFIYSNPVPYRQSFFAELSKYKRIDAPGKSMNNMASIDQLYTGNVWERKREFLSGYKFTIAFENYCYPGYQTEKLYDPMLVKSIPIYCGDPHVGDIFNTDSFLNIPDFLNIKQSNVMDFLERISQPDFADMLPRYHKSPGDRIRRKLKSWGRNFKMKSQFAKADYSALIDRIIEIDKDEALYVEYLSRPWLKNNISPGNLLNSRRWKEIFESKWDSATNGATIR